MNSLGNFLNMFYTLNISGYLGNVAKHLLVHIAKKSLLLFFNFLCTNVTVIKKMIKRNF